MHLIFKNGRRTPGDACGLIMGSNGCTILMESPLIANGAEISKIGVFIKISKSNEKSS
jgi:hypothetical protein